MIKQNKAFTLVELIVVITIIAILWTIAFISLQWYSKDARNSVVINDISLIQKNLELFQINTWKYPEPDWPISWIVVNSANVFNQWFIWDNIFTNLWKLNKKPVNPLTWEEYVYSKTTYWNYYELKADLEWNSSLSLLNNTYADNSKYTFIRWNYNWVLAYTHTWWINWWTHYIVPLPSLIINTGALVEYSKSNNISLIDWMNSSDWLNFKPTFWLWTELPNNLEDLENIMDDIVDSFTWTTIADTNIIGEILNWTEDVSFITIGRDIINNNLWWNINLWNVISRTCELDWWNAKQDWINWTWWECYRINCYKWFVENWSFDCDWTWELLLQASDFNQEDEPVYQFKTNFSWEKVFYQEWSKALFTSWLIPIDITKSYRLSWDFKNSWLNPTRMYFWLVSYDENKDSIRAPDNLRKWNEATISSYDNEKIYTDTILSWWNNLENPAYHQQLIWFYYDWDTNKLPDDVMIWSTPYTEELKMPAYSSIDWQDILLNRSIPEEITENIVAWTTKVMNHYSWGSYIYTYHTSSLSNDWYSAVSADITWESFWGYSNTTNPSFRMWTKYVKVHILANHWYYDTIDYKMEFNNIHFEELP